MRSLLMAMAFALLGNVAQAHFIWLHPVHEDGTTTVHVYFGEDGTDDDSTYLHLVKGVSLQQVRGDSAPESVKVEHTAESVSAKVDERRRSSLYIASHDLGVMERGDAKFRLKYYAKTGPAITSEAWSRAETADDLLLDVVPSLDGETVTVSATFEGKPVAGAQVVASGPGMDDFEGTTDEEGKATFKMADAGSYSIRVRHVDATAGELDGKAYPETRHYTTLTVDVPEPLAQVAFDEIGAMERPVTSFGAALADGHLYVYGGHTGGAHSYSTEEQSNALTRLNLETGKWEHLIEGPHLQGLALVAHAGKLYRIGGFTAKNAEGEDHDLWSQTSVAAYDPTERTWIDLPPLPEPRSSFDAAVLGDAIYVVGGWSMQGDADRVWHKTAWKLDLRREGLEWEAIPEAPFQRRALAVAAYNGKIFAIGGMQQEGGPTPAVDVYDPQTRTWSTGPDLLGEQGLTGFGASAFATGGRLYVSTINGTLQRLSEDGSRWEMVGETPTARFFHRMLPLDANRLLVVGGANMRIGKFDTVEVLSVAP